MCLAFGLLLDGCSKSLKPYVGEGITVTPAAHWFEITGKDLNDFKAGFANRFTDPSNEILAIWSAEKRGEFLGLFVVIMRSPIPSGEIIPPEAYYDYIKEQSANVPNSTVSPWTMHNGLPAARFDVVYTSDSNTLTSSSIHLVYKNFAYTILAAGNSLTYDQHRTDVESMLNGIQLQ